jgi:hypothetical protein
MKTTLLSTVAMLFALAAGGSTARADHRLWRGLDDASQDALLAARDVRWEIHDHFADSRDYEELLEDARALTLALREVQDAIDLEREPRILRRLVANVHGVLEHLEDHATQSEYGRTVPGTISFGAGGYTYRPRTRHARYVHVQSLLRQIGLVDDAVHELEVRLDLMAGGHNHSTPGLPGGHGPYLEGPVLPTTPTVPTGGPQPRVRTRPIDSLLQIVLD